MSGAAPARRALRVGLLTPGWISVPPTGYGGVEWVVALLADGLVDAGHDVTLFAPGDSRTRAKLVAAYEHAPLELLGRGLPELRTALECVARAGELDVVNDHGTALGAALLGGLGVPVLHTVSMALDVQRCAVYERLAALYPTVSLASISLSQRAPRPALPWVANCPSAVDLSLYPFAASGGEHLLYVGRLAPEKGCHRAIRVAREVDLPLKIVGRKSVPREEAYFREHVEPHLGGGIEYLGEVSHGEKVSLMQGAWATLFPIDWEEPFGLVLVESMACGTPVVATRRGAVPEVVEHGRGGLVVDDPRELAEAVEAVGGLSRAECRHSVEERFAPERLVARYVEAYELAIERATQFSRT